MLVEFNEDACKTINESVKRKFGAFDDAEVICGDVRGVGFAKHLGQIDVVAGGPPCQPFSLGGKHGAHNDTRDMFPQAVRVVRETLPKAFIFENVKGLLRPSFSSYFKYVIQHMNNPFCVRKKNETWEQHSARLEKESRKSKLDPSKTYQVVYNLFNSAEYGVPQFRHRVFIVGFRRDLAREWSPPKPSHSYESLLKSKWATGSYWDEHHVPLKSRPEAPVGLKLLINEWKSQMSLFPELKRMQTVRDAIGDLPNPETDESSSRKILNHEFRAGARTYPGHTGSLLDEPAKALKAGDHGVPGGENMVVFPDNSLRYFTVRESARIQTFPDNYFITGSWTEAMRQIGNAVPVKLAEVVGTSVREQLAAPVANYRAHGQDAVK